MLRVLPHILRCWDSKSTLHYWGMRHGDIVEGVLRMLFKLLSLIGYDYSIIDSTKFADWVRGCMSYSLM